MMDSFFIKNANKPAITQVIAGARYGTSIWVNCATPIKEIICSLLENMMVRGPITEVMLNSKTNQMPIGLRRSQRKNLVLY